MTPRQLKLFDLGTVWDIAANMVDDKTFKRNIRTACTEHAKTLRVTKAEWKKVEEYANGK